MKSIFNVVGIAFAGVAIVSAGAAVAEAPKAAKTDPSNITQADIDQRIAGSKDAIQTLAQALKVELETAMDKGGPINALAACNTKAVDIAGKVTSDKGMKVSRVSSKNRSAKNAADGWTKTVMESFDARAAKGEGIDKLVYHEVVQVNGKREFRYMQGIPVRSMCLGCHGAEIKPEVQSKIKELYPNDKATGYQTGDLRGAFVVLQTF